MVSLRPVATLALALAACAGAPAPPAPEGTEPAASGPRGSDAVPRIDLARLQAERGESAAGRRNVFDFGVAQSRAQRAEAAPPPTFVPPPPPVVTEPTPPPVPPLNVKYIGTLDDRRGLKVALLMTDQQEVLTGQAGEVVANRLKIVRIGLESVDVQDLGSDAVRRIPLRGN